MTLPGFTGGTPGNSASTPSVSPAALVQQTPNGIITFANQFSNQPNVPAREARWPILFWGHQNSVRATQFAETNGWVEPQYYYYGGYVQDENSPRRATLS